MMLFSENNFLLSKIILYLVSMLHKMCLLVIYRGRWRYLMTVVAILLLRWCRLMPVVIRTLLCSHLVAMIGRHMRRLVAVVTSLLLLLLLWRQLVSVVVTRLGLRLQPVLMLLVIDTGL